MAWQLIPALGSAIATSPTIIRIGTQIVKVAPKVARELGKRFGFKPATKDQLKGIQRFLK